MPMGEWGPTSMEVMAEYASRGQLRPMCVGASGHRALLEESARSIYAPTALSGFCRTGLSSLMM
jgi:hypothetical protein